MRAQNADGFISSHAYTRHKFDASRASTRSRTQYGQRINVRSVRNQTINNADNVVKHFDANGVHYATTYKKTFFGQNISTADTLTSESRVIINHLDANKSTQFPFYRR